MKTLVCLALAVSALSTPVLCSAQTATPLTRAQVYADLVRVEQAGYQPAAGSDPHYPDDIQAAEAKIAAADGGRIAAASVGGAPDNGSSQSGAPAVHTMSPDSVYFGS
ncbi:DUF4148 domain-containing protein [Burkholderia pyrrocinia]